VANCGGYCLALTGGGVYDFVHSTIANYWTYSVRNTPSVVLTNYLVDTNDQPIPIPMDFSFGNGIIDGFNFEEFETDFVGGADTLYYLTNSLLKTNRNVGNETNFNQILRNEDPRFLDIRENDYRLDTLSPAIGWGDPVIATTVPLDILGNSRSERADAGAYQFVPGQTEGNK
jgi:hypothetical protein